MICDVCGSNKKVVFSSAYNNYLCNRHYMQYYHTKTIKERFMKDPNEIVIYDAYAEIIIYDKKHKEQCRTKIDKEDIEKCKNKKWTKISTGYIICKEDGILLQRFILNMSKDNINNADHINHDILDNRKENLRIVTSSENNMNSFTPKNNTSGVKGVSYSNRDNLWHSYIALNNKRINLGWFKNFDDAVKKRLEAEEKYYKEYSIYKITGKGD